MKEYVNDIPCCVCVCLENILLRFNLLVAEYLQQLASSFRAPFLLCLISLVSFLKTALLISMFSMLYL